MIYGLAIAVVILIGFLLYHFFDPFLDFTGEFGQFLMVIGTMAFAIWIVFLTVFQVNKDINFQANMVVRENIVYAIEHYEDINDDIGLNCNKYDILKKAMDFNQSLIIQQNRNESIFYIWFSNPDYDDVEPIDYSHLIEDK